MTGRTLTLCAIAATILTTGLAGADEPKIMVELTGSWTDIEPNTRSLWAVALRDPYLDVESEVSPSPGFRFSELKVLVPVGRVELFAGYEAEPRFDAYLDVSQGSFNRERREGSAKVEALDAGIVYPFHFGPRFHLRPWAGLTHIRSTQALSDESWRSYQDPDHGFLVHHLEDYDSSESFWGVVYGAEAIFDFTNWIGISGRAFQRWGSGTVTHANNYRREVTECPCAPGDPPDQSETSSYEIGTKETTSMFGFDLGLRATFARWIAIEGGWRYRNWSYDRGPGIYDGPYLRLALAF